MQPRSFSDFSPSARVLLSLPHIHTDFFLNVGTTHPKTTPHTPNSHVCDHMMPCLLTSSAGASFPFSLLFSFLCPLKSSLFSFSSSDPKIFWRVPDQSAACHSLFSHHRKDVLFDFPERFVASSPMTDASPSPIATFYHSSSLALERADESFQEMLFFARPPKPLTDSSPVLP